jgi:hypothetical protein
MERTQQQKEGIRNEGKLESKRKQNLAKSENREEKKTTGGRTEKNKTTDDA